nr:protein HGV2-like isoform X1 [Leptinotarsa decemlineata]XP_023015613.1 protein HGV2-like isoform X1 [Leptinotarsa decemlineata]
MADVIVDVDSKNPKELLAQGVRAFVLQDFNSAVTALSKASELMVAEHGDDLHESLGDVYLYYGKALLGLSREENEALGDAVPRNNDEESDEDGDGGDEPEEDGEENDEASENVETEENGTAKESAVATENEKMDIAEESSKKTEVKEGATEVATNGTFEVEASGSSGPSGDSENKTENDEEPTDLQVAWEVLELAKKIFEKMGDNGKKHLAETLTVLGEISLESENFEAAINDIKDGLHIQTEIFEKDSRTVAETYYKLGIAYSTNSQIEEAIANFKNSLVYLQHRIENLEKKEDKKDGIKEEIEEIKSLIPDIEEKIADMKTYKDEALKKIVSAVTEAKPLGESSTSEASSSKPVTNISHLVKRKRKLDEITDEKESVDDRPAKK